MPLMGPHKWLNGLSRRMRLGGFLIGSFALAICLATASPAASANEFTIGYLQLSKDSRYGKKRLYAKFLGHALGRPYTGAKVALSEVKFHGAGLGHRISAASSGKASS